MREASREDSEQIRIRIELEINRKGEEASREDSDQFLIRIELDMNRKGGGGFQIGF